MASRSGLLARFSRRSSEGAASCAAVRESLSASLDREEVALAALQVSEHVARCRACREFSKHAGEASAKLRLQPLEPLPDLSPAILAALVAAGAPVAPGDAVPTTVRPRARATHLGRWVAATVPLAAAVPALAAGAFTRTRVVPMHLITPCLFLLHHARG
ncbi:MAG: hypothetical protein JWM85_1301 [Acidimicrobiaceae bacterium]|nr:hypothetical protein [Acidimicrobiaceae bacterium]